MSDDNTVSVPLTAKFDIRYLKAGEFSLVIPIPDELVTLIGRIAIGWGGFEQRMDAVIENVHASLAKTPPGNWRRWAFRRRKTLFKEITAEYTKIMFPNEVDVFNEIANRSGDLHWRRNIVVHGYVTVDGKLTKELGGSPITPVFVATGTHKGRDVRILLDMETLTKLQHDIYYLGGKLMAAIFRMGGNLVTGSPELVVADTEFLQDPQSGSFQFLPTPNIPPPLSLSSRGLTPSPIAFRWLQRWVAQWN
jgi:hypothetical protein